MTVRYYSDKLSSGLLACLGDFISSSLRTGDVKPILGQSFFRGVSLIIFANALSLSESSEAKLLCSRVSILLMQIYCHENVLTAIN